MSKFIKYIVSVSIVFIILTFPFNVLADEVETTSEAETTTQAEEVTSDSGESEHSHSWDVVAFDPVYSVVTLKCSDCESIQTLNFSDCLTNFNSNNEYFSAVDVNNDGVINGRDYAYLVRGFTNLLQTDSFVNMFSSKEFVYKESFFYIYLTVMFIVSTGFICVTIRRVNK